MHSSSDSLSGLIKWLGREEWRGSFEEVLNQHLGPACDSAGIEFGEIAEILGDHHFMMLWACVAVERPAPRNPALISSPTSVGNNMEN